MCRGGNHPEAHSKSSGTERHAGQLSGLGRCPASWFTKYGIGRVEQCGVRRVGELDDKNIL